jgi:uncharacterized membrane protein (DUF2068 family)
MPYADPVAARPHLSAGFVAIIVFKYLKAAVFALVGLAALHLGRLPAMPSVHQLARFFRVSPENQIVGSIAAAIQKIEPGQAIRFGFLMLLVAAVFGTEATLLAFRVWWSTYFTIVLTATGLPLEIYEIFQRPVSFRRYLLLGVNAAILIYLWRRRNEFREDFHRQAESGRR